MNENLRANMSEEELFYFSRQFANMFGMPVRIYSGSNKIYYHSTVNLAADPADLCIEDLMKVDSEVSYYIFENCFYYGIINHECYKTVIGPVGELKFSENEVNRIGFMMDISKDEVPHFTSEMKALSGIHLDSLIQALILYNFTVNHTMYDISDIRIKVNEQTSISTEMKTAPRSISMTDNYYENNSRSYLIEQDIIKKVMNGDVDGLIDGATKVPSVSSGQLAQRLLRHHKNFFIRLETIVSRAALNAGLDIDEVFSTEEKYINKCESLDNVDRIKNLQYHMIIDFADRVKKMMQYNGKNSRLVNDVTKYIRHHISDPIKTTDIASYLGKSRGSLTTEFKKQTGMNLSDFIKLKKVQEAKELLYGTNKVLSEISYFLGFSSQSHFCRFFKEMTGITPTEYRSTIHF